MVLISAHRAAGAGLADVAAAARSGVDHVELDVRRTRDGALVVSHDGHVALDGRQVAVADVDAARLASAAGGRPPGLEECLDALRGRAGVHLDLKVRSPGAAAAAALRDLERVPEVQAVRLAVEALGADRVVVTCGSGASVAVLRRWARAAGCPDLPVGLSVGRGVEGLGPLAALRVVGSDLFPGRRVLACGANLLVAQKDLARLTLARWGRRHRVPLLVWTVDADRELAYWSAPGRAWMVTTNRPARALEIAAAPRGGHSQVRTGRL